jgi:hypothetical protein
MPEVKQGLGMGHWALDKEDKQHGVWGDKKQELIMVLSPCPLVSPAPPPLVPLASP